MGWNRWFPVCLVAIVSIVGAARSDVAASSAVEVAANPSFAAGAGCSGLWPLAAVPKGFLQSPPILRHPASGRLQGVAYAAAQSGNDDSSDMSIVGFWKFRFVAEENATIPDGTVIDAGFTQWHDDGTEIENSSRPPATQSFCLGVWKKTGGASYVLNHFALSWDINNNFVGPANIREQVTVDHGGQSYAGSFTIDQFNAVGDVLAHISGDVSAVRITVDTTPADIM